MIRRPDDRPERSAPDELATRRLAVQLRRALLLAVKAIDGYLTELDHPSGVEYGQRRDAGPPGRGPSRPST